MEGQLRQGKMFGVLIVQTEHGETGYLADLAYSKEPTSLFVPPVYDLLQPQGFFSRRREHLFHQPQHPATGKRQSICRLISRACPDHSVSRKHTGNSQSTVERSQNSQQHRKEKELNAQEEAELIRESQFQKAEYKRLERSWKTRITTLQTQTEDWERRISALKSERKTRSAALQQKLFEQFGMLNYRGEVKNLCGIFGQTVHKTPPAGAGECAAPKLLQQAYLHGLKPIAMAEFWWG